MNLESQLFLFEQLNSVLIRKRSFEFCVVNFLLPTCTVAGWMTVVRKKHRRQFDMEATLLLYQMHSPRGTRVEGQF